MKNSFWVEYSWKERSGGFLGEFHADRMYDLYSTTQIDKLIDEVTKAMKTKEDCVVTFQVYGDEKITDILRFIRNGYADEMNQVSWDYSETGYVCGTMIEQHINLRKNNIRKRIYIATKMYFDREEA